MAFPTIPTAAAGRVLFQLNLNPAGTHTSPNLSSLTKNAGDLLIAILIIYDGNSTNAEFSAWGGSFTEFADFAGTTTMGIGAAYKVSTGSETGTFTVTTADTSANDSCFILLSIPGANQSTPPEAGSFATGTAPDSALFNPTGWDAEDTLWITVAGSGETSTTGSFTGIGTAPTNYGNQADSGISADVVGGIEGSVAFRQLNAASEDVGAWSMDTSNARGASLVIAVRPPVPVDTTITPPAGVLTLTAAAPTVAVSNNVKIAVPAAALTLTAAAPSVAVSNNVRIAVPAATLALTASAPTVLTPVTVVVPAASLALTGAAPTVTVASSGIAIEVPAASLVLTGAAPAVGVSNNKVIVVPAAALSLTGAAPAVIATQHRRIEVPAATLLLTAAAPVVTGSVVVVDGPVEVYDLMHPMLHGRPAGVLTPFDDWTIPMDDDSIVELYVQRKTR